MGLLLQGRRHSKEGESAVLSLDQALDSDMPRFNSWCPPLPSSEAWGQGGGGSLSSSEPPFPGLDIGVPATGWASGLGAHVHTSQQCLSGGACGQCPANGIAVSIYHPSVLSSIPGPGQQGAWVMEGPLCGRRGSQVPPQPCY